ncbi:MAG: hypothetical protein ACI9R3_000551 [Verrucomicrobiales bacterium]
MIEDALQNGDAAIGKAALNGGIKALADNDPKPRWIFSMQCWIRPNNLIL